MIPTVKQPLAEQPFAQTNVSRYYTAPVAIQREKEREGKRERGREGERERDGETSSAGRDNQTRSLFLLGVNCLANVGLAD